MSPPLDPPPFPFPWIALRDPPDICCARRGHASVTSPGALPPATVYPLRVNHHEEPQLLPTVVQPERRGPQRTESARAARFFLSARGRSGAARHGAASPARSTGGHRRADANKARQEPADAPRSVEAARHAARDAPPRGNHGVRGEGVRRFGGIIPGHRQRHEGNREVRFPRDLCCVFTAFVSVSGASSPHTEPPQHASLCLICIMCSRSARVETGCHNIRAPVPACLPHKNLWRRQQDGTGRRSHD